MISLCRNIYVEEEILKINASMTFISHVKNKNYSSPLEGEGN